MFSVANNSNIKGKGDNMKEMKNLKGFISWNGFFYAYKQLKHNNKYYKCKNVRFDDVIEVTSDEYFEVAEKYARIFW